MARNLSNPTSAPSAPKAAVKMKDRDPLATGQRDAAVNRSASFNYFLEDRFEAGIALKGTEVKSIREGKAIVKIEAVDIDVDGCHYSHTPKLDIARG
jgi:SsrA-binding protein